MKIDKDIESNTADFRFDQNVVKGFDSHVRKSVPFYDECQRMILELSDFFITQNSHVYDLGVSTGTLLNKLYEKYESKNIKYFGYDNSSAMITRAEEITQHNRNTIIEQKDLNNDIEIRNASLVFLLYTLQFIEPRNRQKLVINIYNGLNDNGAFVFIEKVIGNNPRFNEIFIELYHDLKIRSGLTLEQIKNKSDSLRGILRTYSYQKNIDLLQNAGFSDIDVFFKWYNFVGIIAIK